MQQWMGVSISLALFWAPLHSFPGMPCPPPLVFGTYNVDTSVLQVLSIWGNCFAKHIYVNTLT